MIKIFLEQFEIRKNWLKNYPDLSAEKEWKKKLRKRSRKIKSIRLLN